MTNPPILVITGLGGYFILNFLQKSGFDGKYNNIKNAIAQQKIILNAE